LYEGVLSNGVPLVLLVGIVYWPPGFFGLHSEGKSRLQQCKELDFVGLILFGGGLTSFLLKVSWGNNLYPWCSVNVLVPQLLEGERRDPSGICVDRLTIINLDRYGGLLSVGDI
jgi:hypothetical protein